MQQERKPCCTGLKNTIGERQMRILITNDDGITAEGIRHLAGMAKEFGEVWVVAPHSQCSAMSHSLTVRGKIEIKKSDFPVDGVTAYSVTGTPADCVKAAVHEIMPAKPDIVFSGINFGYNAGADILYSGTVGACMEALLQGVPAIAYSREPNENYGALHANISAITRKLLADRLKENEIWNINFPGCSEQECRGIRWDCVPAKTAFYTDHYQRTDLEKDHFLLETAGIPAIEAEEGTDIAALLARYISVEKIKNTIL